MNFSNFNLARYFTGVFAVIGTWPNWERYFDLSRNGLKASFVALALAVPPLYLIAYVAGQERARLLETEFVTPSLIPFLAIAAIFMLSFPMIALIITMVFDKPDRFRPWVITRHWTVLLLSLIVAALFGLTMISPLPIAAANGAAFAAYMGLLAIDIRLAQKVVGLKWGAAILVGCVVIAIGLSLVVLGVDQINS